MLTKFLTSGRALWQLAWYWPGNWPEEFSRLGRCFLDLATAVAGEADGAPTCVTFACHGRRQWPNLMNFPVPGAKDGVLCGGGAFQGLSHAEVFLG